MPRPISIATAMSKSNVDSGTAFLMMLEIKVIDPTTKSLIQMIRVVNNSEDITFQGNLYTATIFDLSFSEQSGERNQATVSINDYKRYIREQEEAIGGSVGFKVRVLIVNSDQLTEQPELDISYTVTSSTSQDFMVSWQLGSDNVLAYPFPRHKQFRSKCRHKYKGSGCQYEGSLSSCDLTLDGSNGCKTHDNVIHFGGFPGIREQ